MANQRQEKLSTDIKVSIEGGITIIEHSDAYNAQQERHFAGEKFTKQEMAANGKLIEAEETQIIEAQHDPAAFIKQQQAKSQHDPNLVINTVDVERVNHTQSSATASESKERQSAANVNVSHEPHNEAHRLERAKQAFYDASPTDRATAEKNLMGLQQQLLNVAQYTNMTPDQLALAQKKAYMDQGDKLHELNESANKKSNALTWEVANFSQGAGKTMVNADVRGSEAGINLGGEIHHGVNVPGLDLAEVNIATGTNNEGAVSGSVGVRAVKNVYSHGDHNVFLASAADMTATNLSEDSTKLGGVVTGLVVNTHQLSGLPTSEIVGAKVDVLTGDTTAIGSVSQTYNSETKYATTARAIGAVGVESGSGAFSFEAYQRTGIEGLTARLNAGIADVGGENLLSAGAGISYGW